MAVKLFDATAQLSISADDQELNEVGCRVWDAVEAADVPVKADDIARQLRAEGFPGNLIHIAILYLIDGAALQWTSDRSLSAILPGNCAERYSRNGRSPVAL